MNRYAVAFDVGGLFIKAAVLRADGQVCVDTVSIYPSMAHEPADRLLDHLVDLVRLQVAKVMDKSFAVEGIGYAFPGPFDYERGISYIRGVQKFESLYGVNLRQEIAKRIADSRDLAARFVPGFAIVFDNDANLFALGEYLAGKAAGFRRCICVTLGTGTGSAFLEDGQLVKDREDVPRDGWVYRDPFRESMIDDYLSKRGILRIARELGLEGEDVLELAERARSGESPACEVFRRFGRMAGEALSPYVSRFRPDGVVIGGQIAKSHDLFAADLRQALSAPHVRIAFADDTSLSTFVGVASLLRRSRVGLGG